MEALRERFGKYHVLEKIAQGGMAEVYKVKTVGIAGFEKIQALKRILPRSAREGRFIRSFIDEARIAVELTHRNIVQVFDFGKADGELFLAMELIEGKDLRTVMAAAVGRDLLPPIPVAAFIVSEVAQGLDYAHRKTDGYGGSLGIVHCDVSPSNVMVSTDGYVKILDFGIARATFASALERRRLRGKPRYMAPEQTLGEPPTAGADVFALGIIAWELFTGLPLYRGPDLRSILEAVRHTDPPRLDRMNPQVPAEIVNAVARALSREPEQRGSAADLAAACARTAMAAGARHLAEWIGELEQRSSHTELSAMSPWQPQATSISVPPARPPGPPTRPPIVHAPIERPSERPSMRSVTASLANVPVPVGELGEGTPGFREADLEPPTAPARPPRNSAHEITKTAQRYDRDAITAPAHHRYDLTGGASPIAPRLDPTASIFADAPPADRVSVTSLSAPPTEAFVRPSIRFDDDATQHGIVLPPVAPDDTSYDELDVEAEPPAPALADDEPIDDDLGALATGLPAERRRSVVVAASLTGASGDILRSVAHSLGELAYQRGGVVLATDAGARDASLVIAFGLEVPGEDDVAVAMGWALDASAVIRDLASDTGVHAVDGTMQGIQLRIGARTGVAASVGTAPGAQAGVPGDAIDDARALAREAAPDRPLFVGATGRLTSGLYALREVPAPRRVGRRSRVIEVVGPRGFDERDRARFERRGKFVGRTVPLSELEVWYQRAIAAERRLAVLIQGAAGTGKSRLVAELVARKTAATPNLRVVSTAASPASRLAPFSLVIDLYQAALGLPPARGRAARRQVVERMLHLMSRGGVSTPRARAVVTDLDRAMELRDGVSIGAPEVADLRPRISAGLAAFRVAMTDREHPLLTIIEDVHQADSASLEVLRHSLAVPAHGAELLVLTARPEGAAAPAVDSVIAIGDLVGGELRALIADRLGDHATPVNIAAVLARGGGNPLFVEELAQAIRDAGPDDEEVPASARDVVSARLERLSPKARAALRFASVLGDTIRARLLEELLGETSLEPELAELVDAGFLVRPETAVGSSEGELVFARGLVREVVYDSLSARTQRESHARIGRLLASRFFAGRAEPPATIAEHLERGGETAGAAAFWLRAGRVALSASDADVAVACFSRTLVLERELGVVPPTATSHTRRRDALAGREEAHRLQGDLASDPHDLDELQRLCEGDPVRLADVAIRRAQRTMRLGDYANATIATVVAEDHAIAAGSDRLRGEALRVRGEILERLGRFEEALATVGAARELFHRAHAIHDEMAAMIGRGRIHLLRADYEAARDAYRPVLALIEKTGDPWLERIVTNHVAVIEMCLGNFERAMASVQRSLELCRRYGDRGREGDGISVAGIILLEVGLYDDAAAQFAEALEVLSRTSSRWSRADCLIYAGTADVRRGRPGGLALIDEAVLEARRLGARYLEANALVARAGAKLVLARRGASTLEQAIADAAEGTAVARGAALVGYEIQGLARHALALSRLGRRDAGPLVERALSLFEHQRYLEGSEEEVLAACGEVLHAGGAVERARAVWQRAQASARRKLDALTDPRWRAAYAAIPEIAALLR
ncbi:MAG TPA: protein kinase [Kofleriaceae bacterium]|nr:protein kinase [Kofleriaceae bacterium]